MTCKEDLGVAAQRAAWSQRRIEWAGSGGSFVWGPDNGWIGADLTCPAVIGSRPRSPPD